MDNQAKELAAGTVQKTPNRVTLAQVESKIDSVEYIHPTTAPHFTMAFIKLKNGFVVTGTSSCADPANFDKEIGEKIAREDAINKIWAHEGYLLCECLMNEKPPAVPDLPQAMAAA